MDNIDFYYVDSIVEDRKNALESIPVWKECVEALLAQDLPLDFLVPLVACIPIRPFVVEKAFGLMRPGTVPVQDPDEVLKIGFKPLIQPSARLDSVLNSFHQYVEYVKPLHEYAKPLIQPSFFVVVLPPFFIFFRD